MSRPFARLSPPELYDLLEKALKVGGHKTPSLAACEEHGHLAPLPPLAALGFEPVRVDPSPLARQSAATLTKAIPDLREFWIKQVFAEADRRGGEGEHIIAARTRLAPLFEVINKLEAALQQAAPALEAFNEGPQQHWHTAATAFHAFFKAVTSPLGKPYGLQGPALRFVCGALKDSGWGTHTSAAIRQALTRNQP